MPSRRQRLTRDELVDLIEIDDDDIDNALVHHTDYFLQAADQGVDANAKLAQLKLELKELLAELDQSVRAEMTGRGERFTETSLNNVIVNLPRVRAAQREILVQQRTADKWQVLVESFRQRSYILKEINARQVTRLSDVGSLERGDVRRARDHQGDVVREELEQRRREQRRETVRQQTDEPAPRPRYRPGRQDD